MARGTFSGLIWGTVVAVGGVATVSVLAPMQPAPTVASTDPAATAPASTSAAAPEAPTAPAVPQTTSETESTTAPLSPTAPSGDSLEALESADTTPGEAPAVGEVAALTDTATPDADAPEVSTSSDTVPAPSVQVAAPSAPSGSEQLSISTEPAQPTPPKVQEETAVVDAADGDEETPAATVEVETEDPVAETAEAAPETETPATDSATGDTDADTAADPNAVTSNGSEALAVPRIAALPRVSGGMTDDAEAQPDAESAGEATAEDVAVNSVRIGQRAGALTGRGTGDSALPTVRTATEPTGDATAEAPDEADPNTPPIARFAVPFVNTDDKPLMSIVLIDAAGSIGAEALASFPYPLTFAVDPNDPEAEEKMARHRAAGFEVLAMMDLPLEATAQDAETSLEVNLAALPEVVGVIEGTEEGVQGNRALSDQVTAVLRDKGYGFVTQNSGLNTVQKLAERQGVPSAFVFRDFDGAGQTPTVMRRFLDQAAFRAGQEGGVIMLGRVQPDTISALLLWGLQDRASRVALAPVSAVLTRSTPTE